VFLRFSPKSDRISIKVSRKKWLSVAAEALEPAIIARSLKDTLKTSVFSGGRGVGKWIKE
jgi:hypothetical protein